MENFLTYAIANHFFYVPGYVGSKNIGVALLENGECVTTVRDMYVGGIANFIDITIPEEFIDCYKYTLNPDFYKSQLLKEFLIDRKSSYQEEIKVHMDKVSEMENSIKEIDKYIK
jgi:hypothetical protein